ncbi:hypothetical protein V500_08810 [Pseudogymnoascus sp. VKM F-4518 (FW-2643)]|nr:hypothetical protein V500_08810 [Pseudogymnoascus sp. VKM F-4518 (FW-2643)]
MIAVEAALTMPFWKKKHQSTLGHPALNSAQNASQLPEPLDESRWGMFIFADQPSYRAQAVDIIAIHGLNGDYQRTWTSTLPSGQKVNWLEDFLPAQIPNARVMAYGYNSAVQFSKSAAGIEAFAEGFLEELLTWRRSTAETRRPIIFVCHSLGGIVVKEALNKAHERERFAGLRDAVRGITFFGTPHRGADLARWGAMFADILRTASLGTSTNARLVRDLQARSEVLRGISRRFVERGKDLQIFSFWETDQFKWLNGKVVAEDSATLDWPNETAIPVDGDHRSICQFSSIEEKRYRNVWANLQKLTSEIISNSLTKDEKAILLSLYTSDYESHRQRNPKPVPGTCVWFTHTEKFQQWQEQSTSNILWVTADPGCGKSVLSSFLIDICQSTKRSRAVNVCYFFFKDDSTEQRTANYAIQALLHQIYTKQPELLTHLIEYRASKGFAVPQLFSSLWKLFLDTTTSKVSNDTICIIDGLDECDMPSRREFTIALADKFKGKDSHDYSRPALKVLITSRPDNAINNSFSMIANIRLRGEDETEAISEDVERVVQANINQFKESGLPEELLTGLQNKLIKGADRTFLWTTLTITLLRNASEAGASKEDLDAIIESRDIDAVYERLLDVQPRELRPAAFRILQVVLAASRPLTLEEMSIVMELKGDQRRLADVKKSMKHPFENYIKSLCGHFLRIIHTKIYLVHQTARTFLLDPVWRNTLSRPRYMQPLYSNSTRIDNVSQVRNKILETRNATKIQLAVEYLEAALAGTNSSPALVKTPLRLSSDSFTWRASIRLNQAHYVLLISCVKYLMLVRRDVESTELQRHTNLSGSNPRESIAAPVQRTSLQRSAPAAPNFTDLGFLSYAALYWIDHRRHLGTYAMSLEEMQLYNNLCNPELPEFPVWTAHHPSYVMNFPSNPVFISNNIAVANLLSQDEILRFFAIDNASLEHKENEAVI